MPKRKTLEYYEEKIRKLKEKPEKRRRRIVYSSSSDSEVNEDIVIQKKNTLLEAEPDHAAEVTCLLESGPEPVPEPEPQESIHVGQSTELPDLDPEILSALGDASVDCPVFGENIHNSLAQRWLPILKKGLLKEAKTKLLNEYTIPENCKLLKAPTLNFEISAAVVEVVRNRDKSIQTKQDQLGHGIAAINKAITLLLVGDDKIQAIKILSDGCRLLTDLHYVETELRTKLITPCLQKSFLSVIENQNRDDTLFGANLSDKIKASKTIEKQGHIIKKSIINKAPAQASTSSMMRPRHQENWSGPPRYPSSNRGGRGGPRRAPPPPPMQYRRPTTNPAPTMTRPFTSYQTRQRAQRQ